MTADGIVALLAVLPVALMYRKAGLLYLEGAPAVAAKKLREAASILSPLVSAASIIGIETLKALVDSWRKRGLTLPEAFYALGLAALAAGAEVDEEAADLLLYAVPYAVQEVIHPATVLPVLAALRPLGEKAPHRYVDVLATASELILLKPGTVWYIYVALQQLRIRLLETRRIWPLVNAVIVYSNLLRKHPAHIEDHQVDAVADMCRLYGEVRKRNAAAAPGSGLSAHRLFDAVARAYVLAVALERDGLARHVQRHCGLGDIIKEAEAVRSVLDEAAAHLDELRKIMESDADFAEWVTARDVTGDVGEVVETVRSWLTYELALYKLDHAIDEKGELDEKKLEEVAKEFEKAAEMSRKLDWRNYFTARSFVVRARVLAARSWEELLEKAKGFWELWREAEEYRKPTAIYLAKAAGTLGECLIYLAASGNKERAEKLLKEWRQLLDHRPEVSVVTRLMLRLFGVGDGAKLDEVVNAFEPQLSPKFWPALSMLASRLQRDKASEECAELFDAQPPEAELCNIIVAAAAGNRIAAGRLRSVIEKVVPEARLLLDRVDGKTLVEVLAPMYSSARLAFMLLAAVEGRADAVRLHGLWGYVTSVDNVNQPLFRVVYENCGKLDSEDCRLAMLKLHYYHY
jgi:tetratricopeptide (TPR) repeat protein